MKENVIIFGNGPSAEVCAKVLFLNKKYQPICFTVDKKYIKKKKIFGLPVIDFKKIKNNFKPSKNKFFVSVGYSSMNTTREKIIKKVKRLGYKCISIIHPKVNLPPDFVYGENCLIMNDVDIHPLVKIGKNNFIWSGAILCHHVKVGDNCWFTSGSSVAGNTKIGNNCFLGINATVTNNIKIKDECFIGARALVAKNLSKKSVVISKSDIIHKLNSYDFLKLINDKF